jgi:glycerol 3-phosphatase-2
VLGSSSAPLCQAHDLAMLDLDGVVYVSGHAIEGAPEAIAAARDAGLRIAFVTNNASRPPEVVAENLVHLGVPAWTEDVVTSAQAAARMLAARLPPESRVLMLGGEGLGRALVEEALVPVRSLDDGGEVVAVVTGYGPEVLWRDIMRAAVRIREGLWWVATNTDLTIPTSFGSAPGHGVLVRMLEQFTGVTPDVAGKPARPLLDETVRRVGGSRPLMVGDRLDTDIEGANHAGVPSLLVLTGVTGLPELVAAPPRHRPTYLAAGLTGLLHAHPAPAITADGAECGGWRAQVTHGRILVGGTGAPDDWWRAVAVASWAHLDRTGVPVDITGLVLPDRPSAGPTG